jgi:hypothetical protein
MHIRFENRLEDMLAFNQYHLASSTALRRAQRRPLLIIACLGIGISALIALSEESPFFLLVGSMWTALCIGFIQLSTRWRTRRITAQMLTEGSNKSLYGWHELELEGEQLTKRSLYITTIMDLRLVEKIAETPDHAFIYISAVSALIIPRRDVPEADYQEFFDELRERLRAMRNQEDIATDETRTKHG